jgi:hypothetical protein
MTAYRSTAPERNEAPISAPVVNLRGGVTTPDPEPERG